MSHQFFQCGGSFSCESLALVLHTALVLRMIESARVALARTKRVSLWADHLIQKASACHKQACHIRIHQCYHDRLLLIYQASQLKQIGYWLQGHQVLKRYSGFDHLKQVLAVACEYGNALEPCACMLIQIVLHTVRINAEIVQCCPTR